MSQQANRLENLNNLRMANADGAFATAFATLVTGAFMAGFITLLGGSDFWINLTGAVPSLLGLLQIPGAVWGKAATSYKRFVFWGGALWRGLYIPFIALPFLPLPNESKLWLLMIFISVSAAAILIVNPTYNEWLADMVPPSSRGFFFSRRNAIVGAVASAVGLLGAVVLDAFKRHGQEKAGFSTVFALASVCAGISFFLFSRMHDTPRINVVKQSLGQGIRGMSGPFVDHNFRKVLIFLGVFTFAQSFAGNLFSAYAIKSIHLPYVVIQWCGVFQAAGTFLSAAFWGFLADKYGNKPTLMIAGFGITLTPAIWLACSPDRTFTNALILFPAHILNGVVWAGVSLCQFNLVLATSKAEDRANYLSVMMTVGALVGFFSPLIGAQAMEMFSNHLPALFAYRGVFAITMGLRFVSVFFLIPVVEEGAVRVRRALRELSKVTPRGMRAMRSLTRSGDVSTREQAIESLASEGYALGGDEIIKALHDPSPRVRRQAALAVAKLNDPLAVEALIHQLDEHPDLVEEETVEALGQVAGPEAVPPLVRLLQSPRSLVRRAAAKALGRIGSADAIQPLISAAAEPGDPDLRRASVQALRALGAVEAEGVIADALFDPIPSVRIAAAEAVSELGLESALPYLRESLSYYHDEAMSEIAYALGAVGTAEDIPAILVEASECVSMTTRRRCLLGIARVLGVESESYKLLLLEGMPRDRAIMDMLKPLMKGNKRLRDALSLFSAGDEAGAIRQLVPHKRRPEINCFADRPVEELFLVAVCAIRSPNDKG